MGSVAEWFWQRAFWVNKLCGSGILRKRFFESRASAFLPTPCFFMAPFLGTSVLQHGILPMPFLFLWFSDRRLPFCFFDTLFHTSQLCRSRFVPWRFSRPTRHGTLSKVEVDVRWTFFRTDLYGWTEGKTSCLDTPDGGEKVPLPQPTKVMGVDKFFTTLYNIYCSKKPHNMACKTKITNILYYITGESYGYFSEML